MDDLKISSSTCHGGTLKMPAEAVALTECGARPPWPHARPSCHRNGRTFPSHPAQVPVAKAAQVVIGGHWSDMATTSQAKSLPRQTLLPSACRKGPHRVVRV